MVEADYRLRVYTLEQVVHAPRKVEWSVVVLRYFVLKNKLSVKNGRTRKIVYDDGDNAKEKGGT